MKIFLLSLPYDKPNSGDYDYCYQLVKAINESQEAEAVYVDSQTLKMDPKDNVLGILAPVLEKRNKGGKEFYDELRSYYEKPKRQTLVNKVTKYIEEDPAVKKILSLQIRAPETGFLLSPQDLVTIKKTGVKICITCHEYKLNYDRRWLQSILHYYFIEADMIFFFNEKDQKNAAKHANYSMFWEYLSSNELRDKSQMHKILNGFHSCEISVLAGAKDDQHINLAVSKNHLSDVDCAQPIG